MVISLYQQSALKGSDALFSGPSGQPSPNGGAPNDQLNGLFAKGPNPLNLTQGTPS